MESLFIDGEYVQSQSAVAIEVENPATEELTAEVPDADAAGVGKTLKENRDEIDWSVTAFRHLGELAGASAFSV
jgi:acyl-CoA reductase-like NAD-dependent aldehyde dehydrogenase